MIRISKRMQALADMVSAGGVLCDVGCDHGYLPIYLIQKGVIERAIAMDIGKGPLNAAKTHIADVGLADVIETRLSDGLEKLSPSEADTILIAGMGGGLVLHILSEEPEVAKSAKELILQPQSEIELVRKFLCEQGYQIIDEDMVIEDGKFYPMMKVCYVGNEVAGLTKEEIFFGPILLKKKDSSLLTYLQREIRISEDVLGQLKQQTLTEPIQARIQEKQEYLLLCQSALAQIRE